ncbi:MAG: molybdopterin-synthase adenylyltransferase MoeB [Rhodospirillaceae bacterium]
MDIADFTEEQVNRYARHILLREVGGTGQAKLLESRVLVIGAGGLGSPVLMYLAAAGVGTIGVIDDDVVDLSNLQRQIVHSTAAIGMPKVASAEKTLKALNPDVTLIAHRERINAENALDLMAQYDLVADGSDNFETRFLVNDAAYFAKKTLVTAAILRFDGQIATFKAHEVDADGHHGPCYRCIFREPPPPGQIPSCAEAGVLGALCGTMGSLQATEILKELTGAGESLSGRLMIYEGLSSNFRKIKVKADPGCPLCGDSPTITDLSVHQGESAGPTCQAG